MTRKIIIDCDPGIDDAIALCMALFDPRLEVLAITATAGTVDADQATSNAIAIVEQLDPKKYPRIGKASVPEDAPVIDDRHLNGADGLGGCHFPESARQHLPLSEKVIAELVRKFPNEVTVVCLGPTTNLARICRVDPGVLPLLDKIVIGGGSVAHVGNVTASAEFNMYFDPMSAADVFESATTKSMVPLDLIDAMSFGVDLLEKLPPKHSRAGNLLHKLLPFAFRAAHQRLGRELIPLSDATTILSIVEPDLFTWKSMAGRVETRGELTRGVTVFDQRLRPEWPVNMEVALDVDADEAHEMLVRGLRYAGQQT
ncbi:Pyrimidine-specific ribonucleoside hydrolase RihA [Novipirellula galeiformis]|uniref:Pyrimidine-specific ribonucleoside hydrolase RihA n=1 Tax=Novipirellula galeiformis TaxID=2528004 RepID=A0A5C6CAB9_9BACT|nr:nucleoside hydrolase [Novipirellula galeiformis]TWU21530.1 Pyrimidine-specific ribonucleoside hydrolase RihA [Novipirellula galeiformis]